ncbi:MAG: ABC transporter ATP-binding protein [Clostridia bacterium]|nr:ABC transporter ATP-binding protein [Clostridia bacterium]
MFKLFKKLVKYKKIIPFIILLIAVQAILTLMLPDYMSKIISEGIKSPAYEISTDGQRTNSIINPKDLQGDEKTALSGLLMIKKYARTGSGSLLLDENGYAQLAGENGEPLIGDDNIKQNISYEKDVDGNYITDSLTGEKILKYARTEKDYIITDDLMQAAFTGYETDQNGMPVLGTVITNVLIYDFDKEPNPLKTDNYNYVSFLGTYTDGNGQIIYIKLGDVNMPALKFEREGEGDLRFGTLYTDSGGFASLKQVSYIDVIIKYGLVMLGITFMISIAAITANFFSSRVSMSLGKDIRSDLYNKINKFSLHDTSRFGAASLITRTTNDVVQVQTLTNMIFRMVVMTPIMFIGGIIMALNKNAQMMIVLLFTIPLILLLVIVIGRKVVVLFKSMQKKIDSLTLVARENLTGVRVIRAFNKENIEDIRFDKVNEDVTQTAVKANRIMSVMFPSITLLMSLTTLAIIAIAVISAKNNILGTTYTQFANMMAVSQYIMQIMMSLLMIIMLFVMFPRASASAARINEVMEVDIKINNPLTAQKPTGQLKGISFDNVSFKFEGSEAPVLSNINLQINGGETVSIIGSTGSGKSTLINLIPRLFDVSEGSLKINGVDVRDYDLKDLRQLISFVPQKSLLFSGTIADNLKFGDPNASREKMLNALGTAQIKDFVISQKSGLDSAVEQGGVNFSGGQKQRLSIARAIIKDAEIYIFDDSFSALDFKTDYNLRASLKQDLSGSTVIIVSQRISTVMDSDKIIVLDEGKIAGIGKHKELYNQCKIYREIALSQLSIEELN